MKDNDNQDIKLLVRLRGNTETKAEKPAAEENDSKQGGKPASKASKQVTPNQSKLTDKKDAKKPNKNNSQVAASKETTDDEPKCTIFTSVQPSKTILCTNTPISKKLINSTFIREDDLYEYSYTFIKDSTLLEFDRVYSDAYKLENIYTEQIKECISNLFLGKNACILQFGPAESGKSYSLRNPDPQDPGLINQAINDIFNLIEISKSTSKSPQQAKNVSTIFSVKLALYQVYNDCLNDLLSTQYAKNLTVERLYADESSNQNLIPDLSLRELKSKKDFELALKEADNNRKNLSQSLKVNDLNKKSHLVTSLVIEKREKIPDGYNRTTEQALENFAQIDFVELADANLGLAAQADEEAAGDADSSKASEPVDDLLYRFVSKTFNSVTNNVLCAASGREVKNDSKLTLALKNTLRASSQIILFTNAIPTEEPLVNSIKALKFTNWLRNQLVNQRGYPKPSNPSKNKRTIETVYNRDSDDNEEENIPRNENNNKYRSRKQFEKPRYNKEYYSRERPERDENNDRRDFNNPKYNFKYDKERSIENNYEEDNNSVNNNNNSNNIQRRSNEILSSNYYNNTYGDELHNRYNSRLNDGERKNYVNSSIDKLDDFEDSRNRFNYKYQTIKNDESNEPAFNEKDNIHNYSHMAERMENRKENNLQHLRSESKNHINNNYDNSYISNNNQSKIVDVERTLRDLEAKSLEMSKHIENLRNERSRVDESRYANNPNSNPNVSRTNFGNTIDYEYEKLRQENSMLKSDNIIFREDINRLSDMNRHLEEEIRRQRDRNLELASENERLSQEKLQYKLDLEKATESLSRSKLQEQNAVDQLNIRFVLENKIKDLENENRNIRDEKQRYEIDFKVLQERHLEFKKNFDANENELNFVKHKQAEEVNNIEDKLDKMAKEIEHLQRDNNALRSNEERIRQELLNFEKQRDNYREKYQETKSKNNILNAKLAEIEDEFKRLLQEKHNEYNEKRKEEETRKVKIDSKQKILEDMQSKILSYKTEILKNRNKKD